MQTRPIQLNLSVALLSVALLVGSHSPLLAQQGAAPPFEMTIKISRLQKALGLIDDLAGADPSQPMQSPSAQLAGMLQGTHWIDPTRSIILGLEFMEGQPKGSIFVPFIDQNEGFQAAFNAMVGPDYYLLSLPPAPGQDISPATKDALIAASKSESKDFLTVDLALSKLLTAADGQIKAGLSQLDNMSPPEGTPQMGATPQEIKQAVFNMLNTAGQLEVLTLGLDLDENRFATSFEVKAAPESKLAQIFTQGSDRSLLHSFRPEHQINFRYRNFDMVAVMELVDDCFGEFYRKMGIDFSEIVAMCESFTGEVVGGMSFDKEKIAMEIISVLQDTKTTPAPEFLEKVYIPWMAKSSQDMAKMLEEQTGTKIGAFFARTPDSTVGGYKVMGVKTQFPSPQGQPMPVPGSTLSFMEYDMRMTTVGNLLLMAHNDEAIARLINVAKTVKEGPAQGPMMTMHVDMGGYLDHMAQMIPGSAQPLPKMGKMVFEFDMNDGRANGDFMVMTEDIKTMVTQFKNIGTLAPAPKEVEAPPASAEAEVEAEGEEEGGPVEPPKEDPAMKWFGKGALCATYGNDKAAVEYFKKVLELDPENSEAHFQQGVSYGELGKHEDAISSINKAVEIGQRKGLYLYGRGRVYLLSGDEARASEDFKEAAALGHRDAQEYLEDMLHARR